MKKIFVVPVVAFLLLCSMIPFTSYADAISQTDTGFPSYYYDKEELEERLSANNYDIPSEYFYFQVCNVSNYGSDKWVRYYQSYYFYPYGSDSVTGSESNGVYTFISSGNFQMVQGQSYCYYSYENPNYVDFRDKECTLQGNQPNSIVFDSVNNTVTLCTDGNTSGGISLTNGSIYSEILEVDFNMDSMTYNPDALNVQVEFHPELVGSIDRSETLPNGVVTYQDLFNFNVINNSRFGIQWCMAIVEHGSSVEFNYFDSHGADSLGTDFVIHTDDIKYIYLYTEDVYLDNTLGFYLSATAHSPMHFVSSQSESGSNLVKWDMVNLDKDHTYDVVVYAVRNDADKVSFVHGSMMYNATVAAPVYFSDMQEVYRSTFSLVNPAKYDSNSKIGGSIANDSNTDYRSIGNTLYSYTDPDGSVNYGQYDYSYDVRGYTGGSLSYIDNYSSNNSGKFQTLMRNTSSVFGFYAGVLKFFPTDFLSMYQLGIFSLVVIAIIRRLT